jgi:hypothetical protein
MGENCGSQCGQLGDALLHETAVSWIRRRERMTLPAQAWEETYEEFGVRMKGIVSDFNTRYDVCGLCHEFPERIQSLIDSGGAPLKK